MKIFAQDGYGPSDKIDRGCDDDVIQGSILSPRYRGPDQFEKKLEQVVGNPHFELYLDPKIYAAQFIGKPNAKLGKLEEWDYFEAPRRPMLITGKAIPRLIEQALKAQKKLPLAGYIAPNIYVDSANSIDAAIALNIIGTCRAVAGQENYEIKKKGVACVFLP